MTDIAPHDKMNIAGILLPLPDVLLSFIILWYDQAFGSRAASAAADISFLRDRQFSAGIRFLFPAAGREVPWKIQRKSPSASRGFPF
jgi:hypothetical protein